LVGNEHLINLKHCSKWQLHIKGLLTKRRKDEIMWGGLYSEAKIVISQASKKKKKKRFHFPTYQKKKICHFPTQPCGRDECRQPLNLSQRLYLNILICNDCSIYHYCLKPAEFSKVG
jgi:hypothetical protein